MGVDVMGWVEVRPSYHKPDSDFDFDRQWVAVVSNVGFLAGRNYEMFGCLFGVRNHANFIPLAAERGIPDDASEDVQHKWAEFNDRWPDEAFSPSWITWAELKAVDWEAEAPRADSCIHQYKRDEQGQLVYVTKSSWDRRFAERVFAEHLDESMRAAIMLPGVLAFPPGQEWEIDGVVYRSEKLKRKDALDDGWRMLFAIMEALAGQYGDDGVRLVAWFYW